MRSNIVNQCPERKDKKPQKQQKTNSILRDNDRKFHKINEKHQTTDLRFVLNPKQDQKKTTWNHIIVNKTAANQRWKKTEAARKKNTHTKRYWKEQQLN